MHSCELGLCVMLMATRPSASARGTTTPHRARRRPGHVRCVVSTTSCSRGFPRGELRCAASAHARSPPSRLRARDAVHTRSSNHPARTQPGSRASLVLSISGGLGRLMRCWWRARPCAAEVARAARPRVWPQSFVWHRWPARDRTTRRDQSGPDGPDCCRCRTLALSVRCDVAQMS